jgi:hypothetical protein
VVEEVGKLTASTSLDFDPAELVSVVKQAGRLTARCPALSSPTSFTTEASSAGSTETLGVPSLSCPTSLTAETSSVGSSRRQELLPHTAFAWDLLLPDRTARIECCGLVGLERLGLEVEVW